MHFERIRCFYALFMCSSMTKDDEDEITIILITCSVFAPSDAAVDHTASQMH